MIRPASMLRLGVLAYPVTAPADWPTYAAKIDALVAEGAAAGAQLLLMPEYACMEAAAFHAGAGNAAAELQVVCALSTDLLALFQETARRHKTWLLPGTMPWPDSATGAIHNRAPLIAPDGTTNFQYKSVMTRFETEHWGVEAGPPPRTFETPWGTIGIAICYDSEFPTLVRTQTRQGAWLILVPSCTDSLHGYNRVRLSARARALENQCYVAVAPTVGAAPKLATLDENQGYAAIFGPVDRGFSADGIIARGEMNTPGWIFADLDPERLQAVRANGAVRNFQDWPNETGTPA